MISAEDIRAGNRLSISKLLSEVENDTEQGRALMNALFPLTGKAYFIGVTGAPGTGKSSLVNEIVLYLRKTTQLRIAIIAVDPSSPFSGGAILGDRIRMHDLYGDEGVFIRSMASRGALGGLAARTAAVASALDASGFDLIIIETVGAGQSEVDIARLAHTVLVVEAPGFGDDIQAIKAGILEIADILVVNKADQPGAENTMRALESMISLSAKRPQTAEIFHHGLQKSPEHPADKNEPQDESKNWQTRILKTVASQRSGIEELCEAIFAHKTYLLNTGYYQVKDEIRLQEEFRLVLIKALYQHWLTEMDEALLQQGLADLKARKISPQGLASRFAKFT